MEEKKDKKNTKEISELKKQVEEYLNNWRRERADFVNYKKDEAKRMEEMVKFSSEGIIMELIDVIDAIEVTRNNLPNRQAGTPEAKGFQDWVTGFDSSLEKMDKFLNKFGVEKIKVEQVKFDPMLHEAVEVEDQNGQNIKEIRPGYTMHGKVIRPARVKIIK